MSNSHSDSLLQVETTCTSFLHELKIIWDEVGEPDTVRDKMLHDLERECIEVYRKKLDQANEFKDQHQRAIADAKAELASICSSLGEQPVFIRQSAHSAGSLKGELNFILPKLEDLRKRKCERRKQFVEVLDDIRKISNELHQSLGNTGSNSTMDETDLSSRKLEDLHGQLRELQKEKSERLKLVLDLLHTIDSLCIVLGMDFKRTVSDIHPSLEGYDRTKSVSNDTIKKLTVATKQLREVKIKRMQKLQDFTTTMLELWNLMDTPIEEQQMFRNITCNVAASEQEITEPNRLSLDFMNYVEAEVLRLEGLKTSKMKELVLKKKTELEEICRRTHLVVDPNIGMEHAIEAIESGTLEPAHILEQIELQISKTKEEAFDRKEILEKVDKWMAACEEESWLEEYNKDENRYNAGRGTHLSLKRAEKARSMVTKIPAMVEALASKIGSWEKQRGTEFTYDGFHLLSKLEDYTILRLEKEEERRRQREQKKLQGQVMAEQGVAFGSKLGPSKPHCGKKASRVSGGGGSGKKHCSGGSVHQTQRTDSLSSPKAAPYPRPIKKNDCSDENDQQHLCPDDESASSLTVRRGFEVARLRVEDHASSETNDNELQSPVSRIPFSPISPTPSSTARSSNILVDEDSRNKLSKMFPNTNAPNNKTPTHEESRTPKNAPTTPPTVSIPMQMAATPAPLVIRSGLGEAPEGTEYSFEEQRAGFGPLKTPVEPTILL